VTIGIVSAISNPETNPINKDDGGWQLRPFADVLQKLSAGMARSSLLSGTGGCRMSLFRAPGPFLRLIGAVVLTFSSAVAAQEPANEAAPPSPTADSATADEKPAAEAPSPAGLLDLDIDQLGKVDVVISSFDVPVTSVTKGEGTVGKSPAAIFVITQDMIRRSGATSVPETLRMVPGLSVAHISGNTWAITSRGLNSQFANKLLVMIDGRSVYSPLFAGVHWDTQDLVLQDIERIEVIRGPGSTLWGANAVNGVINIITKKAEDTQGLLGVVGAGSVDKTIDSVRYGGKVGDDLHYRIYGKGFDRGAQYSPLGASDDWRQMRGGFRADWTPFGSEDDFVTFQGDIYGGTSGNNDGAFPFNPTDTDVSGGNFLARWNHQYSDTSSFTLQGYYDKWSRNSPLLQSTYDTFDLDFTRRLRIAEDHGITWGLGARAVIDDFSFGNPDFFSTVPVHRQANAYTGFIQDEMTLIDETLFFTLGSKFEQNAYTGFEYQPSGRLLWNIDDRNVVWGAVARAVRVPSRIEDDIRFVVAVVNPNPLTVVQIIGNRGVQAEDMMAYELGYRAQPNEKFSWDAAAYINRYENIIGFVTQTPFFDGVRVVIPQRAVNGADGIGYGFELTSTYQMTETWRMTAWYSYQDVELKSPANSGGTSEAREATSPHNQAYLMSSWDLPRNFEVDLMGRYVDNLAEIDVSHYISMDVRLGWRPNDNWELSVVGQNLLEPEHKEFNDVEAIVLSTEMRRAVFAQAVVRY
jgi:iron complex outermembrane recepter protein